MQEKQLSPAVVAGIVAAGDLARILIEVPTGWFADRFGHRRSLIVGSAVQAVAMMWCWLGEGVPSLITASLLVAIGDGFRSGADEALLYRTCLALRREDAFITIASRTHTFEVCALALLVLAGGLLAATWGFAAAWIAETALCAAGVALACALREPPPDGRAPSSDRQGAAAPAALFSGRLVALVIPAGFLGGAAGAASFFAQTAAVAEVGLLTVLVASITLAEAAGAAVAARIPAADVRGQWLLAAAGGGLLAVLLVAPAAFPGVVLALSFLAGVAEPLRAAAVQHRVADGVRARAASLGSAWDMIFSTIALPLSGWWAGR